jgi:hypothetical protein
MRTNRSLHRACEAGLLSLRYGTPGWRLANQELEPQSGYEELVSEIKGGIDSSEESLESK